jgi:ABC-type transport system substrate-binding protein
MAGSYAVVDEICYHYATFTSGNGPVSYNNYSNPTYNALIAKCDTLPAGSARTAVGVQLQKFVDQQVPSLSLLETPTTYGLSSNVSGYTWSTFNQLRFDTLTGS